MTRKELIQRYQAEIAYQKQMIANLKRWVALFFLMGGIGGVIVYFYRATNLFVFLLGIGLIGLGILGMLIFGYGIYHGTNNLELVVTDFDKKLKQYKQK